jgi:hypothetical protein
LSVFVFVQGKESAEDGSGFGIGQVDMAQIPKSRAHAQALEMVVAGRDLKTDTLQTEGAVGAALGTIHFSSEGYFEFGTGWTGAAYSFSSSRFPGPRLILLRNKVHGMDGGKPSMVAKQCPIACD